MSKVYFPDRDVLASGWLNWPEECLLPRPRLEGLYSGNETPRTKTEEILAANRRWLLDHALGQYVATIDAIRPLPELSATLAAIK